MKRFASHVRQLKALFFRNAPGRSKRDWSRCLPLGIEALEGRIVPTSVTATVVNNSGFPLIYDDPDTQKSIIGYINASNTDNNLLQTGPPGSIANGAMANLVLDASGSGVEADVYFFVGKTGVKDDLYMDNPLVTSNTYHQTFLPDNGYFQSAISGGGGVDANVTYTVSSIGGNLGAWGNVSAGPTSPFNSAQTIPSSDGAMNMLLLPNGNVMIHGAGSSGTTFPSNASPNWYLLQPDSTGAYSGTNAQITTLQPMSTGRRFFATDVLPNDTVFAFGAEYSSITLNANTTTGSTAVTGLSSTSQLVAGMQVTGSGIPAPTITGTTTTGSAIVTGLSSTGSLIAGMIVSGPGIPNGTTIKTINTTSSITLSANATASGSVSLTFNDVVASVNGATQVTLLANATATAPAVPLTFSGQSELDTGEFYNPATNGWNPLPPLADTSLSFGDQDAELVNVGGKADLLASDPVSRGSLPSSQSFLFNVPNTAANSNDAVGTWTATGSQQNPVGLPSGDSEDNWALLPNGDVLAYQVAISDAATASAELYVPSGGAIPAGDGGGISTGQWVNASTGLIQLTSGPPFPPANAGPQDMGPGVLLPNLASFNGSPLNGPAVVYFGWNGSTAYYNPATNSWAAGPTEPIFMGKQMSTPDGPAAVLPNGEVLLALSPQTPVAAGANYYPTPTRIYLFNPNGNFSNGTPFMDISPPDSQLTGNNCYQESMLVLPTGQILMSDSGNTLWIYTPTGSTATPLPGTQPTITSITTDPSTGLLQINGTLLNGPTEGAYYGDDEQMSSNYPLVQLTDSSGNISYATTSNWQAGVVGGGTSANFTLPSGTTLASFASVALVADGLFSAKIKAIASPTVVPPKNQASFEGTSQAFDLGSFIDPSGSAWSVDVNWGDGTPDTTFTASPGPLGSRNHTYGEEATYKPKITVTDTTNNLSGSGSFQIAVTDPAVLGMPTSPKGISGLPLTGVTVATFTDPGGAEPNPSDPSGTINNHYQVLSIDWGDSTPLDKTTGTLSYAGSPGSTTASFTISGSHTYTAGGMYTITVLIAHESATPTSVTSTATIRDNLGLLVLDPSGQGALTISGAGPVVVNNHGAVVVNSNNASAAILSDAVRVVASDIDVTGGVTTSNGGRFSTPVGQEAPTPDPLGLSLPPAPATTYAAVDNRHSATLFLAPGTYVGGIKNDGKGNIVLAAGIYYLRGGGLQVNSGGSITGTGVLIINAPTSTDEENDISILGTGNISLSAPSPASLPAAYAADAGVTILQDPAAANPILLLGHGSLTMDGALYAPAATLRMSGDGGLVDSTDTTAAVAEVIVKDVYLSGNGGITINADAPASNPPANSPIPGAAPAAFVSFVSSTNPSVPGQFITLTATMSSASGPPAGSIDFFDETTHLDLGSVTLAGGVAQLTTSAVMTLGDQTIGATYFSASPNFAPPAAAATLTQHVQSALNESGVLFVGGNPNSREIDVELKYGMVEVDLNDGSPQFYTPLAGLTAVIVYGQGNDESIQVDSQLLLPAFLFAGDGFRTHVQGGGGPTLEVGGSDGGILVGGAGRNILIAGSGGAILDGGYGGSILIAGYTDYDSNLTALMAALLEWSSTDSYSTRLASAALSIFNTSTVHSDSLADPVSGAGGTVALDWLFASPLDRITGINPKNTVVTIS